MVPGTTIFNLAQLTLKLRIARSTPTPKRGWLINWRYPLSSYDGIKLTTIATSVVLNVSRDHCSTLRWPKWLSLHPFNRHFLPYFAFLLVVHYSWPKTILYKPYARQTNGITVVSLFLEENAVFWTGSFSLEICGKLTLHWAAYSDISVVSQQQTWLPFYDKNHKITLELLPSKLINSCSSKLSNIHPHSTFTSWKHILFAYCRSSNLWAGAIYETKISFQTSRK